MSNRQGPQCDACGKPLPPGKDSGLCANCLWASGQPRADEVDPESPDALEELSALLPDFEWLEVIGHGGMGTVYKARQRRLDRIVAVKVLSEEISVDKLFASRFEREAKILAKLNHPHIVTIHDFGQELDLYYLVMEFVEGVNLGQILQRGPLDIDRALRVARQLCAALLFAHERSILHRDIKPSNILLDAEGMVKIADFGLAKLGATNEANPTLTMPGTTMGTPRYMAPEQWETPEQVDHRADIFAFGMIFYQMLTSKVPSGMIQLPSETTNIDSLADRIVRRCLAPEPTDRYENARALEADLIALDRTSGAQLGLRSEDSWLRPPTIQLPHGDSSEAVTTVDSASHNRPSAVRLPTSRLPWRQRRWIMIGTFIAFSLAGFVFWKNQVHRHDNLANSRLTTLPALVGAQWWFDDMPYLIPPVRLALSHSESTLLAIDSATSSTAVTELRKQLRSASLRLSQKTQDDALAEVLHDLLKRRSLALDDVASKVASLAAQGRPEWQHTYGTILQRQGQYAEAIDQYRQAVRGYTLVPAQHGLMALCMADLGRCYGLSGLHEEAVVAFDQALSESSPTQAPYFQIVCLADKSGACRRIQAWDEAELALKQAANLLQSIGAQQDHPLVTYIHQRFGWLYMDAWKLEEARAAFQEAIASRKQQLSNQGSQEALGLQLQQSHDEMAFAMCQRYAGQNAQAIASYETVRQSVLSLQERVNRAPNMQREWLARYHNICERLGDCYLFDEGAAALAVSHFHQSALDLKRALMELKAENAETFLPQLGRYLAKQLLALAIQGSDQTALESIQEELGNLALSGSYQTGTDLFTQVAQLIWAAQHRPDRNVALVTQLQALVEANKESQFGRDVREVFLLAARELAKSAQIESAPGLAQIITLLLPKEPIDPSVLPFLRPHFDRLINLRLAATEGADWDIVRDMHLAKTGSRLTDPPKSNPALMVYYQAQTNSYSLVRVNPDATCQATTTMVDNPSELWQTDTMATMLRDVRLVYWTDLGLRTPWTTDTTLDLPQEITLQ